MCVRSLSRRSDGKDADDWSVAELLGDLLDGADKVMVLAFLRKRLVSATTLRLASAWLSYLLTSPTLIAHECLRADRQTDNGCVAD